MATNSKQHVIGFEVQIPECFAESEDSFLNQLLPQLRDIHSGKLARFVAPNGEKFWLDYSRIFGTDYHFTQIPKGW